MSRWFAPLAVLALMFGIHKCSEPEPVKPPMSLDWGSHYPIGPLEMESFRQNGLSDLTIVPPPGFMAPPMIPEDECDDALGFCPQSPPQGKIR